MGITLILIMGMLAFIINVGLFVKAKINLQNAVDAAAFSGASTQARQLTNIAYANWELRNTYKEWMFKYYVLGQTGLFNKNLSAANLSGKNKVNYLLETPAVAGYPDWDKYNLPSICIHNSTFTNICQIYAIPGIPRFPAVGVAGISEIHEAFVNKLVEEKGKDCSRRSELNFLSAQTWAYGSGLNDLPGAPMVAASRPGAWLEALELAFRIRNLEMIVNRPPVSDISILTLKNLEGQATEIGFNERPIKSFWSAYRNLGGGDYKDRADSTGGGGNSPEELSYNFRLTELAPKVFDARQGNAGNVSSFLIPNDAIFPSGAGSPFEKRYLDLQLMTINYATMFSTFVSTANQNTAIGEKAEATCGMSRTALPVPGYILGYTKNPEVMTYYAVKGESKFIGLFFPNINSPFKDGFKLTAYSAAKPFGGRIGPRLFKYSQDGATVLAREDINRRSASYVTGLRSETAASFKPGMPIPSSANFWVNEINKVVGGIPGTTSQIFFSVPNMIYDFDDEADLSLQRSSSDHVQQIKALPAPSLTAGETLGLYHAPQIRSLKDSLGPVATGGNVDADNVMRAIVRSRRPTKYDVINYLVPDFRPNPDKSNAAPMVQRLEDVLGVGFRYKLFAPLIGPNLLYKNKDSIKTVINAYMKANEQAVDIYLQALLDVGRGILATPTKDSNTNIEAAKTIHINSVLPGAAARPPKLTSANCAPDMASKFWHFFRENSTECGIVPLSTLVTDFIERHSAVVNGVEQNLFYIGYFWSENSSKYQLKEDKFLTAYYPGQRQGTSGGDSGISVHPLNIAVSNANYSTRRNYYSTKFFQLAKIIDSPPMSNSSTKGRVDYQSNSLLREQVKEAPADLVGNMDIKNPLQYDAATGIDNKFFLDF